MNMLLFALESVAPGSVFGSGSGPSCSPSRGRAARADTNAEQNPRRHPRSKRAQTALATRILLVVLGGALVGCVAPSVVVVDQKTALEQQAAGGYPTLENDLEQAGLAVAPEPFAHEELAGGRERAGRAELGELAELYVKVATDADAIDQLLLRGCVGEARSGLLEPRPSDCIGATDATELARLVGRENLHRRQLWQLIASQRDGSVERAQQAWRELHLAQVVCGGLVEVSATEWSHKSC